MIAIDHREKIRDNYVLDLMIAVEHLDKIRDNGGLGVDSGDHLDEIRDNGWLGLDSNDPIPHTRSYSPCSGPSYVRR